MTIRGIAGSILLAAAVTSAAAQLSSHWQACTGNPGIDWDTQIRSCTALILSGTELKENVAIAFYNRALAYENKEKYDLAIADYSEAIGSIRMTLMHIYIAVSTSRGPETKPAQKPTLRRQNK